MICEGIAKLVEGKSLSFDEAQCIFEEVFSHQAHATQIAALLTALAIKGENAQEIAALAYVIRKYAHKLQIKRELVGVADKDDIIFDSCGTGGGGGLKFNISTVVALVVAAAGVKVAKHGNRAMSSKSGSADCLEALGVKIDISPEAMTEAIKNINIGFLYAPLYHPALKDVATIRREIGIKTIFNIAGPLSNPAGATHQLLGVYRRELLPVVCNALKTLGVKRALVVYSDCLKDEVSLSGVTSALFLNKGKISKLLLTAKSFGLKESGLVPLRVRDVKSSVRMVKQVLANKPGACLDIVLANCSCAFFVLGMVKDFKEGVALAREIIANKRAAKKLTEFVKFTQSHA
jgi:anthranilate phosphoribosyltransferase